MATLGADKPRVFETGHDDFVNELPMIATDIIYAGAAVGEADDSGTFEPLASGDKFAGFAEAQADNSTGAASAVKVRIRQRGRVILAVTGASAVTDMGKYVYATDDDTFTLTVGGSLIGTVVRWISGTSCVVDFTAFYLRQPILVTYGSAAAAAATVTDTHVIVATRPYYIRAASCTFSVTAGGASDIQLVKDTATDAPGAGTNCLTNHSNAGFDLSATANTPQTATFASAAVRKLAVGDRLSVDWANAIQNTTVINITVELMPL